MLKIGLTGGIGTGKSIVAKVFQLLGIPVYVSDYEAKRLMNANEEIRQQLISRFGADIYQNDGLNKAKLASIIFKENEALKDVNAIVHPVVRKDFERWAREQIQAPYVIQESAILFDTGLYKNFDKIITVTANDETRIQRVIKRDHTKREMVEERMKNQLPEKEKVEKSDFVIYNNGELILPQIIEIDKKLRQL
jgi:dephospho-CoA kinase